MTDKEKRTPTAPDAHTLFNNTAKSVGFDYERYAYLLNDTGLSDEDKQDILSALWAIITEFVQMGFGIHPIQEAYSENQKERGQIEVSCPVLTASVVNSTEMIGGQ